MSHQPERKEKNCLNCGTIVAGYYCQNCGQPNIITKQSFWSLAKHFVYDIVHFDGKFFHTLRHIFFRPGFVARQYVEGKRASYLDPIRMYLFTSALFFLVLFGFSKIGDDEPPESITLEERREWRKLLSDEQAQHPSDTTISRKLAILDSMQRPVYESELKNVSVISFTRGNYRSLSEYDSLQAALPPGKRDGWFFRKLTQKSIAFNMKYKGMEKEGNKVFKNYLLHQFPYMLFFSLPFFALILKLVYVRHKQLFYSDHAIFTLFHYILSFLLLLFLFSFDELKDVSGWKIFNYVMLGVLLSWFIYFFLELKYFYRQGWGKTFLKYIVINILGTVLLVLLLLIFFFLSIFQL